MTPKQLRSAAHALRTAANALEDVTTQLRTLATEIDTPDDLSAIEPAVPAWPTAPYVWWDGYLWEVTGGGERYVSVVASLHSTDLTNLNPEIRVKPARFAREAIPVTLVPTAEWEVWRSGARWLLAREPLGDE